MLEAATADLYRAEPSRQVVSLLRLRPFGSISSGFCTCMPWAKRMQLLYSEVCHSPLLLEQDG